MLKAPVIASPTTAAAVATAVAVPEAIVLDSRPPSVASVATTSQPMQHRHDDHGNENEEEVAATRRSNTSVWSNHSGAGAETASRSLATTNGRRSSRSEHSTVPRVGNGDDGGDDDDDGGGGAHDGNVETSRRRQPRQAQGTNFENESSSSFVSTSLSSPSPSPARASGGSKIADMMGSIGSKGSILIENAKMDHAKAAASKRTAEKKAVAVAAGTATRRTTRHNTTTPRNALEVMRAADEMARELRALIRRADAHSAAAGTARTATVAAGSKAKEDHTAAPRTALPNEAATQNTATRRRGTTAVDTKPLVDKKAPVERKGPSAGNGRASDDKKPHTTANHCATIVTITPPTTTPNIAAVAPTRIDASTQTAVLSAKVKEEKEEMTNQHIKTEVVKSDCEAEGEAKDETREVHHQQPTQAKNPPPPPICDLPSHPSPQHQPSTTPIPIERHTPRVGEGKSEVVRRLNVLPFPLRCNGAAGVASGGSSASVLINVSTRVHPPTQTDPSEERGKNISSRADRREEAEGARSDDDYHRHRMDLYMAAADLITAGMTLMMPPRPHYEEEHKAQRNISDTMPLKGDSGNKKDAAGGNGNGKDGGGDSRFIDYDNYHHQSAVPEYFSEAIALKRRVKSGGDANVDRVKNAYALERRGSGLMLGGRSGLATIIREEKGGGGGGGSKGWTALRTPLVSTTLNHFNGAAAVVVAADEEDDDAKTIPSSSSPLHCYSVGNTTAQRNELCCALLPRSAVKREFY